MLKTALAASALTVAAMGLWPHLKALSEMRPPPPITVEATIRALDGRVVATALCGTEMGTTCDAETGGEDGSGLVARLTPFMATAADDAGGAGKQVAVDVNLIVRERLAECPGGVDMGGLCGTTLKAVIATKPHFGSFGWSRVAEAKGPYELKVEIHGLDTATAHRGSPPAWVPFADGRADAPEAAQAR